MTTTSAASSHASPRLTLVRRLRVLVRRSLYAGLRCVPGRVVTTVHDRWITPEGRRRSVLRPAATALFYRPVPLDVFTVPGGAGERMAVVGARMERLLWWYGEAGYEYGEAGWWRRMCTEATDVLEIGANIGYYTVVGGRAARGRYTAVDANPEAADIVRRNVALNRLDRVEVVQAAVVGDGAPDHLELAFPDQETHSVAPLGSYVREGTEGVADRRAASRSVLVPTIDASSLFEGRDLVKLDIEGAEASVLDAAYEEIQRSRPIMLIEVLEGSVALRRMIARLVADRYRLQQPGHGLVPISIAELDRGGNRDVLLVPEERAGGSGGS